MSNVLNELNDATMVAKNLIDQGEELAHVNKCLNEAFPSRYYIHGESIYLQSFDNTYLVIREPGAYNGYN